MDWVSVAGCLGYDVLVTNLRKSASVAKFQLLVWRRLQIPAHHNLNNQQLKHLQQYRGDAT
jgi:hypothetical protein